MTKVDPHPNLRHRRQADPSAATAASTHEDCGGNEGTPLIGTSPPPSSDRDAATRRNDRPVSATDGYVLVPLSERSILARLDVWPFLLCYGCLVSLDFVGLPSLGGEQYRAWIDNLSLVTFPVVLVAHLGLFLVQQWSVSWRATVGYQQCPPSSGKRGTAPRTTQQWTHCLVEAPHVDKHHSSDDAGIVPIRMEDTVAVVNFQDIIFRCKLGDQNGASSVEDDADITLWGRAAQTASSYHHNSSSASFGFHRLRYPIHFPLEFYNSWKGFSSIHKVRVAQQVYGSNMTPIELPPFVELLQEQVVAPFFLFQILCVILWSLDEYWYYALFTFFALLMFESTVAYNRLKSLERLRSYTTHRSRLIWVHRPAFPPGTNGWVQISLAELVPGDVVSCKQITLLRDSRGGGGRQNRRERISLAQQQHQLNRVPADILILDGDAVVDEALLTGESVPQLKIALEAGGGVSDDQGGNSEVARASGNELDLQEHRQSILFGGTTLVVSHPGKNPLSDIPNSPDQGAIGIVLRTGFETAQGSLLRTMAHTQKSVDGIHTRDTYVFILLLLCCAIASAAMVWEEGWNDPTRNKFRLVLHVIIIVTSVVPPELPMELSLAVTNSVADLMKRRIYCTEVFRIPLAGKVNMCCFDKTGTLTSDEMQLKGVRVIAAFVNSNNGVGGESFTDVLKPDASLPWPALRVMVACHSLALTDTNQRGSRSTDDDAALIGDPLEKAVLAKTGYKLEQNNTLRRRDYIDEKPETILVLKRFGFNSRLKRMSVLVREGSSSVTWVLTKGAPETVKQFIRPEHLPHDYDEVSMHHMALGQRVLAMAYRQLTDQEVIGSMKDITRDDVESDLIFAGFLLLHCPIKPDSRPIVSELWESGNKVVMITGDALLTAAEVARQVGIVRKTQKVYPPSYSLKHFPATTKVDDILSTFRFVPLAEPACNDLGELNLVRSKLLKLKKLAEAREITFCVSGDVLQQLVSTVVGSSTSAGIADSRMMDEKQILLHPEAQAVLKDVAPLVSVFARHAPRQKEAIVAALNLAGFSTLMCGDGTNDVGALRRAHVGISIISAPEVEAKQRSAADTISHMKAAHKKERKKKGTKLALTLDYSSALESSLKQIQEAQDELDQVELGDASIASPFTSRMVSIKCCKDVIQQGRCTLVTMLQIYKILGVNCLVNAMILSKLFLHGVKQGDRQLTILGLVVAALFFFVTRGKPLPVLSAVRPPTSVLCPQALLSISSQFAIHYATMVVATDIALSFVDPFDPSMIPDGPFNPNTLNTCTFLINGLATVNTFAVNYRGEPFVEPLRMNKMLWRSLQLCYGVLFACALEVFPPLNDLFQLADFPDTTGSKAFQWMTGDQSPSQSILPGGVHSLVRTTGFPLFMSSLMICDTLLAFAFEKLIVNIFEDESTKY